MIRYVSYIQAKTVAGHLMKMQL